MRLWLVREPVADPPHGHTATGDQQDDCANDSEECPLIHGPTLGSETGSTGALESFHAGKTGRSRIPCHSNITTVPVSALVIGPGPSGTNDSVRSRTASANSSMADVGRIVLSWYGIRRAAPAYR